MSHALMTKWKERISPRIVLMAALLTAALLQGVSLWPWGESLRAQTSVWLPTAERIAVDLTAPLETLDGRPVSLADQGGEKVLFLNFWATWCGPCRAEMPSIASLDEALGDKGLRIVAVTDEDPETVRLYLERNPYPFEVLIDKGAVLTQRLKIWSIPWTLVFDKQGKLVHFHEGARLWDTPEAKASLQRILDE